MGKTKVLGLNPDSNSGGMVTLMELQNSYGSAPVVWESLCRVYIAGYRKYGCLTDKTIIDKLWALFNNPSLPIHQRAVLTFTFDRAVLLQRDFKRMAAHIRSFLADFPTKPGNVNHWPEIADLLDAEPCSAAVGLWCTSVSENPFQGACEDNSVFDWGTTFNVYDEPEVIPIESA